MIESETADRQRRRRIALVACAGVVVLGGAAVYLLQPGNPNSEPGQSPTPTVSVPPEPAPTRTPVPPLEGPFITPSPDEAVVQSPDTVIPPELTPVSPESAVAGSDDVRVALTKVESVDGQAIQPGEVAGPALRVTVTLTNGSNQPLNTDLVVVNAYVGPERAPAGTLIQPGGLPMSGTVAPGGSTYGIYLFVVPEYLRDDITIGIDYRAGQPTVIFRGEFA